MEKATKIVFRPMEPEDLEPCVDLYRVVYRQRPWREDWKHSVTKRRLEEIFGAPNRFCYGAWEDQDLVAFCLGTLITRADRLSAQIAEIGVDPQQNQLLIGRGLLRYVLEQFAERGVKSVQATSQTNSPAFQWLQEAGFHMSRHYVLMVHRMGET